MGKGYGKNDITINSTMFQTRTPGSYPNLAFDRDRPVAGPGNICQNQNFTDRGIVISAGLLILLGFLLVNAASAADIKPTYLGDMVTLSGYSPGSDIVYLFLTGPNLPANGVALNNIDSRADMGGFSTADVDPDGHWVYKWYTNQLGGKIDTGAYTVWVTDRPVDRSHLSGSDYRSIPVLLQQPGIAVGSSTARGTLMVRTIFEGSVLFLDGENRGLTPVTISDLPVGTYELVLASPGYQNLTIQAVVQEGATTDVNVSLANVNGSLYVNSTPAGAEIFIDGARAGISPVLIGDLAPGNYTVEAVKAGYNATNQEVRVIAGHMMIVQLSPGEEYPPQGTVPPVTRAAGMVPVTLVISMIGILIFGRLVR